MNRSVLRILPARNHHLHLPLHHLPKLRGCARTEQRSMIIRRKSRGRRKKVPASLRLHCGFASLLEPAREVSVSAALRMFRKLFSKTGRETFPLREIIHGPRSTAGAAAAAAAPCVGCSPQTSPRPFKKSSELRWNPAGCPVQLPVCFQTAPRLQQLAARARSSVLLPTGHHV